jgi:hypothetical protein
MRHQNYLDESKWTVRLLTPKLDNFNTLNIALSLSMQALQHI